MPQNSRLTAKADATSAQKPRVRYSVDLPTALDAKIAAIADQTGEQKSYVIRRAISYFLKCEELRESGFSVHGSKQDESGTVRTVEIVTV